MRCIKRDLAVSGVAFARVQSKMARIYAQDAGGGKTPTTKNADCIENSVKCVDLDSCILRNKPNFDIVARNFRGRSENR